MGMELNANSKRLSEILAAGGVSVKDAWMGEHTGIVTLYSRDMAEKAARLLQAATFRIRGMKESVDYAKKNTRSKSAPSVVKVWRVWIAV